MPKYIMTVQASILCHTTVEVEADSEEAAREVAAMTALDASPIGDWDFTRDDYYVTNSQPILPDPKEPPCESG